jgi:hypothetical protein
MVANIYEEFYEVFFRKIALAENTLPRAKRPNHL